MNLADGLSARAAMAPDSPAVIHDNGTVGIGQLEASAWTIAAVLRDHGLRPGDVVGLAVGDPLLHLAAIFALARCGIAHLPVQPRSSPAANAALLRRIGATAVVSDVAGAAAPSWRAVVLDPHLPFAAHGSPDPRLRHDGPGLVFSYKTSSGTTSAAKLIGVTHESAAAAMERVQAGVGHLPGERFFSTVGLHSDGPRRRYMACVVAGGVAVMPARDPTPLQVMEMIDRLSIRHLGLLPNHARELLEALGPGGASGPRFPDMRCLRLSAAPSDDGLRRLVRERLCPNVVISYGCSELGPVTSADPALVASSPGTVGHALPGISVQIVDEAGMPVPPGASGLVRLRAEGMPAAYHDDPVSTARHFRDGWFYPGDLGVLSPAGELKLLGRADDVIVYDGLKIPPVEIEAVLLQHPAVREAAAFPVRSARSFQLPAVAVELRATVPPRELFDFAYARLGNRCPAMIHIVRSMPRNAAGKILKRELAAAVEGELARRGSS